MSLCFNRTDVKLFKCLFLFQTGRRAPSINNFRRKNVYLQLDFEYNYVCLRAIVVFMPVCQSKADLTWINIRIGVMDKVMALINYLKLVNNLKLVIHS